MSLPHALRPGRALALLLVPPLLAAAGLPSGARADEEAPARVALLPAGEDLSRNPGFEEGTGDAPAGWLVQTSEGAPRVLWGEHGIEGTKGLRFAPAGAASPTARAGASQWIPAPGRAGEVDLTVWVRLSSFEGFALVWARLDAADGFERREGAYGNSAQAGYELTGSTIWSPVTLRLRLGEATRRIVWGVLVQGTGTVDLDEARVVLRTPPEPAAKPPEATGPGVYRASGRYRSVLREATPRLRVLFPVPILWRDQVPLDFACRTEPPAHLGTVRLLRRRPGGFLVAEVDLVELGAGEEVSFAWDAHVLVLPHRARPLPTGVTLPVANVPDEVRPWLASTWCCDAADERVRAVAAAIREVGATADVVVPATLERMRSIFRTAEGDVDALTAVEALTKRGSCTSCANLGAALLRAHGIPARVIAGYPTWSGPLQTHYVVEYWLPEGGWRVMESTKCLDDRPGWEQIEVAMVLPEDEAEERAGARRGAAPGVPWLSLTEYPDVDAAPGAFLVGATTRRACDHEASLVRLLEASPAAWAEAATWLAARWRALADAAVEDPAAVAGLAPAEGVAEADSLHDLLQVLGHD